MLAVFFSLPFILYVILLSSYVQTFIISKVTHFLKDEFGLHITIERIDFRPINRLVLERVYFEDLNGDTLGYLHSLTAGVDRIDLNGPGLYFDQFKIDSVKFNLFTDSVGNMNLLEIIDLFSSPSDTIPDTTQSMFRLYVHNLVLERSQYKMRGHNPEPTTEINFDDLVVSNINAHVQPFDIYGDTISIAVKSLTASDKCGITINTLSMDFAMEPQAMIFDNLNLSVGETKLATKNLRLNYLTDAPFNDFENNVGFEIQMLPSYITSDDLSYFASVLKTYKVATAVKGYVSGSLNNLQGVDVELSLLDSTKIKTSFTVKNLLEFENLYLDVDIKNLETGIEQLNKLSFLKDEQDSLLLPTELLTLKSINYKGKIKGYLNNLLVNGLFKTNLGALTVDAVIFENQEKNTIVDGYVNIHDFQIGTITNLKPTLDRIKGKINFKATIGVDNTFEADLKAIIPFIDLNQYRYQNINIDGLISNTFFDGSLKVNDTNLALDFTGRFEYGTEQKKHRFILNLQHMNLYGLNFDSDSTSTIQFDMVADMAGIELDKIVGSIKMYDTHITRRDENVVFSNLDMEIGSIGGSKFLRLNSDFFKLDLTGQYSYNTISYVLSDAIEQYLPAIAWSDIPVANDDLTNIRLNINLRDIQPVVNLFDTTLKVSNNSSVIINYTAAGKNFNMKGSTNSISYGDQKLNQITISGYNEKEKIVANISANDFEYLPEMSVKNLSLNTIIQENVLTFNANWNNYNTPDTTNYSGYISAQVKFPASGLFDKLDINILPSNIIISDTTWNIAPSTINIDTTTIKFAHFSIGHRYQYLEIDGIISKNKEDTLFVKAKNINIEALNVILEKEADITLGGVLSADIVATSIYSDPFILAQIELDKLTYNDQLIGDTKISSTWDPLLEMIHVDWISTVKNYDVLYIVGDYDPARAFINFRLFIDRFDLSILNPYLKGILHDLSGRTTSEIIIKGKLEEPKIEGVIILDRATFLLDYTQTRYHITDWIDVAPDALIFNDLRIVDDNNNFMVIKGSVEHENFDEIALDIKFNARNFMFLNTLEKDNDTFYGTVFASGAGTLKGELDNMDIALGVKTEPNTRFFIPLNSGGTASQVDYITFVEPEITKTQNKDEKEQEVEEEKEEMKIKLMLNLEVTPDAEVQIIFDPTIGDIIKAKGSSNLTVYMHPNGELEMFGDYIISEGDYLFTLQDIFQKRFAVAKGSSITWSGDAANASVDLDAVYRVRRASLYELTFNAADEDVKIAADAHLVMTGTIMAPTINFNVTLPATAEEAQEQLKGLQADEISKQVISLLVLSRFQPLPGAVKTTDGTGPSGVESNASELLSNQVSNWLSQISKTWDLGFNYTPGGETTSTEYEVAVSTQLLNNRVTINTNVGVGGQQVNASSSDGTNIAGDFEMEVKLDKKGKIRFKGYAKSDNQTEDRSKQGAGVFYREEFNTFRELWNKLFGNDKK
ncbi:MAG: translocation/assembly module TamB domain-containing protein [Salinivirgaceae bacterium]|nr:translocation/assembly module TamB domain-containing protein [Salinivirgaceae bacterium]